MPTYYQIRSEGQKKSQKKPPARTCRGRNTERGTIANLSNVANVANVVRVENY